MPAAPGSSFIEIEAAFSAQEILPAETNALPRRRRLRQPRGEWRNEVIQLFSLVSSPDQAGLRVPLRRSLERVKHQGNVLEKRRLAEFGDRGWTR
jgi:hypothetical protein